MAAICYLGFYKFTFLTTCCLRINVRHHANMSRLVKPLLKYHDAINFIFKMAAFRHGGHVIRALGSSMKSTIVAHNLVGIDAAVLMTCKFQYFSTNTKYTRKR